MQLLFTVPASRNRGRPEAPAGAIVRAFHEGHVRASTRTLLRAASRPSLYGREVAMRLFPGVTWMSVRIGDDALDIALEVAAALTSVGAEYSTSSGLEPETTPQAEAQA
jgi:hypothetical protein